MTQREKKNLLQLSKIFKAESLYDIHPAMWARFGLNNNNEGKINFIIKLVFLENKGYC